MGLRWTLAVSACHFSVTIVVTALAVWESDSWDEAYRSTWQPPERWGTVSRLLLSPGRFVWDSWSATSWIRVDVVEWTLVAMNSLLWGYALTYLMRGLAAAWYTRRTRS
jgi:hypothetical protein